jgi:hypothetical protein
MNTAKNETARMLDLVRSENAATPTMTNAELHQAVLRLTHAVNNLLQTGGIVRQEAQTTRKAVAAQAAPSHRERIMAALSTANNGKPGHLTTVQLQQALGLSKSEVWHAYSGKRGLVNSGDVVVVRGKTGGPDVLYHVDAIAL